MQYHLAGQGLVKLGGRGEKIMKVWVREIWWLQIPPQHNQERGKKKRLMQYIQQNVVFSGEDRSATSMSENNQTRGGETSNSLPTPLSSSDKLPSMTQPTTQEIGGCNSEVANHQNARDVAPNPLFAITIPPPTPPKIGQ